MFPDKDFLVAQERYKELLREAEQERLIQAAGLRQPGNWRLRRRITGWIGDRMVRWGWKLLGYETMLPPCCTQLAGDHSESGK
jgi:hypothetical protein